MSSVQELEQRLRIGELARLAGVTTRTIRYYEELGLLRGAPERGKGAQRSYGPADVARLRELIRLRDLLGLSLEELLALAEAEEARAGLREQWADEPDVAERLRIIAEATEVVERQLALLRSRQQRLEEFAGELEEKLRSLAARRAELDRLERPPVGPARRRGPAQPRT